MNPHPEEADLAELAQGMAEGTERAALEAHLETCAECRGLVATLLRALGPEGEGTPRKGQVVGRFVVLEPIGAGAIGEVFSAWDSVLERTVALKRLHPSLFGNDADGLREKLLAEARALAKVHHPHVVSVFDVVPWDDTLVIVMELIPHAKTLRVLAKEVSWRELTRLYVEAGRGLLAAHAAGVVHRDFKPDNALLGEGRVRVCDFGLSLSPTPGPVAEGEERRSSISGTPAYLAPERWQGAAATPTTDAWAFATSLYEGLCGALPFQSRTADTRLVEVRKGPPPIAPERQVPAALEAVLRRALALDPAERFASLTDLVDALEGILAPRRSPSAAVLLGIGGLLVLGTTGLVGLKWRSQCDDAALPVAAVWNAKRSDSIRAAFLKTEHPSATALAATVVSGLDALAQKLGRVRSEACTATAFRGDSDALLTARNVCVAGRLADLDALSRSFENADLKTVERSAAAVEALGQGAECFEATVVGALPPPPATRRQDIDEATRQVAELRALRLTGHVKEALAAAPKAGAAADASGWRPVMADAESEWGNALERSGKLDDARTHDTRSLALAFEANDFARAYSAAVELAFVEGYDANKVEVGQTWLVLARSLLAPAHLAGTVQAFRADNVEATLLGKQGRHAEAAEKWKVMLQGMGDTPSIGFARTLSNYGSALREAGKPEEGLVWLEKSEKMMETLVGLAHPDLAAATNNLGSGLSDLGRFEQARPWFEKSLEIREKLFGVDGLPLATTLYNLGELALRTGDGATALRQYGRSRAIVEKARGPDDDDVWDAKMGEALALLTLGRFDESAAVMSEVLPRLVEHQFPPWNIGEAKLGLAEALSKANRDPQRVKQLAAEVKALEGPRHEAQRARAEALLSRK